MWSKRYVIANALVLIGAACTAYASMRPTIVTPTLELLEGRTFGHGNVYFAKKSADGTLLFRVNLNLLERQGVPGVYHFPVEQFLGSDSITVTQYTRRYKWEMTPNPEVAKWKAVAGKAIVTVKTVRGKYDEYVASLSVKDLVLQRVGSDQRCDLGTLSIEDLKVGLKVVGCGGGFPDHQN
jgi:hypothetical protein